MQQQQVCSNTVKQAMLRTQWETLLLIRQHDHAATAGTNLHDFSYTIRQNNGIIFVSCDLGNDRYPQEFELSRFFIPIKRSVAWWNMCCQICGDFDIFGRWSHAPRVSSHGRRSSCQSNKLHCSWMRDGSAVTQDPDDRVHAANKRSGQCNTRQCAINPSSQSPSSVYDVSYLCNLSH